MAINLDNQNYTRFVAFAANQASQSAILRFEPEDLNVLGGNAGQGLEARKITVKEGDGYGHIWRNQDSKDINDEIRASFLSAVCDVCGVDDIEKLPPTVLAAMKKDDYGKGRPLTARRITCVNTAILRAIDEEKANRALGIKNGDIVVAQPKENMPKYETPDFAKALPAKTQKAFMSFYGAAIDAASADGVLKETCDATFKAMFDEIGEDANDRKMFAEMLAAGKPQFLEAGGKLPSQDNAIAFAQKAKAVLDKVNAYRGEGENGELIANVAFETIKTMNALVSADELELITNDEYMELYDGAAKVKTEDFNSMDISLRPVDSYIVGSKKSFVLGSGSNLNQTLNYKLTTFRQNAYSSFDQLFPEAKGSPAMKEIKKNLFMNLAITRMKFKMTFGLQISLGNKDNGFVNEYPEQREFLNLIAYTVKKETRIDVMGR